MANFIKAHGLSIANNGYIENSVVESLSAAPSSLENGRIYYDSIASELKYVKTDGGVASVFTVGNNEALVAFKAALSATTGSGLVGITATTGANGEYSTVDGTAQTTFDSVVAAIDAEIKRAKGAEATLTTNLSQEVTDRTAAFTALYDGGTSTIAALEAEDTAQATRLTDLEDLVDGDMGDFAGLTNLVDYGSGEVAPQTLVDAINAVDADLTAEAERATSAEGELQSNIDTLTEYTDTNFLNKTSANAQSVTADTTFSGNLRIEGDLTTVGSSFTTESEVVTFADNVLTLNSNVTTGTATENAGLEVSRGDDGSLSIFTWDELNNYTVVPVWDATAAEGAGAFVQEEIATKPYAEANFLSINSKIDTDVTGLQDELDATQTGAGLNTDGTYTAPTGTSYLGSTTSLKNADVTLDSTLKTRADNINTAAGISGDSYTANASSNYITAATSLVDADNKLDARLKLTTDQVEGKIGNLTNLVNLDNTTGVIADNLVDAINDVDADLTIEVARAQGAESAITTTINNLKDGSTSTISDLDTNISTLTANLSTEITNRISDVDEEEAARIAADNTINQTITSLKGTDYDGTTVMDLVGDVAQEVSDREAADTAITDSISTMKANINAMYYTFTAATPNTTFSIAHNLNSEFVNVQVWVYDDSTTKWKNDIVAIEIVDNANLSIFLTESRKVKVIVNKIAGL